jgi:protein O-mannosyl-transferase
MRPKRHVNVARTKLVGVALLIVAGTLWLYWPSLQGGFLTRMDDDEYLRQAVRLKGVTRAAMRWAFTTTAPYYHPLPRLSHILDYQLWGTNAAGHHATNVFVHALNAALVFGFLWTLFGAGTSLTTNERLALAIGVAVVFAIHPLQVESVAWLSGRTQLSCTTFAIGCLWAYAAGAKRWLVLCLFVAALLCKPLAVSLPFVMLALDYFPLRRFERLGWGRLLGEKAALLALAVVVMAVTMLTESRKGGLLVPLHEITLSQRLLTAAQSLLFYPCKLVWPARLSPYYPRDPSISGLQPAVLASALCVGIITILAYWRRRQLPALGAGWIAYVALILPVSGLLQTGGQAVADRYAYAAILPLLLTAGGAVVWLWRRGNKPSRFIFVGLLISALCLLALQTRAQIAVWRNDETLWRGVLAEFPDSDAGNEMLAQTLLNQNRIPEALVYAQHAVAIDPDAAETHRNLGIALTQADRIDEAIAQFNLALQIKPDLADTHHNLALALLRRGNVPEAITHWEKAVQIRPDYAEAHCNLGVVLEKADRIGDAVAHFVRALQTNPDYAEAHYNLGVALEETGHPAEAIAHYEQALRAYPDYIEAKNRLTRLRAAQ